jgi:DNA-binding transcriptional LysR family regulator
MKHDVAALGRRVDLNLIVVFEAIHRTRNLTAAGHRLGLSQPAMSHALSRLRWAFKDPLFVRLPRGLQPTPLADRIAPALSQGLATIRGSFEQAAFEPAASPRTFSIAMSDIGEVAHLPRVLRAVEREAPGVRIRTVEMAPADARTALGDGQVDFALGVNLRPGAPFREALLVEHGYATVARAGHPFIRTRLTPGLFRKARHLLVMPTGPAMHGEVIRRALESAKVRANIAVQVAHFHPVAAIVAESDLIATIPMGLAQAMQRSGDIRVFTPPIALPKVRVSLYWHERFHLDPGSAWFRELYVREVTRASSVR